MKSAFLYVVVFATLLVSCGHSHDLRGRWQLTDYCYGADCVSLTDHNIVQLWIFEDSGRGRQVQQGVMDNALLWHASSACDTIFTSSTDGTNPDTLLVSHFEADTLELSSLLNNILVRQRFIRQ